MKLFVIIVPNSVLFLFKITIIVSSTTLAKYYNHCLNNDQDASLVDLAISVVFNQSFHIRLMEKVIIEC